MKLQLNYTPPPSPFKIAHTDKVMLIGSCFAENIGLYFNEYKFNCLVNPNGILFNPISISKAIRSYIENSKIENTSIVKSNDLFFSLHHHGENHSTNVDELTKTLSALREEAHQYLKSSNHLIITFGSAFVYRHLQTNSIVANCHKIPQQEFKKELLTTSSIVSAYLDLIGELQKIRPEIKIIFTVSPVKYLRDGVIENNLSKSILIQSVHDIVNANSNCFYFPAYELVNDDLRDYRFYKEDLAHPNDLAIKYIWQKFSNSIFSEETQLLNEKIKNILQGVHHRPIHKNSDQQKLFKESILKKCCDLEKEFDYLDFSKEKTTLS